VVPLIRLVVNLRWVVPRSSSSLCESLERFVLEQRTVPKVRSRSRRGIRRTGTVLLRTAGRREMRCSGRMHVYVGAPSRRSQVARVAVMSRRIVGRDERGCGEGAVVPAVMGQ
jgi:hypothetical protein